MQKHGLATHFTAILTVFLIMPNGNFNGHKLKSKYYVKTTFYRTMIQWLFFILNNAQSIMVKILAEKIK